MCVELNMRTIETVDGKWKYGSTEASLKVGDRVQFLCNGRGRGGHYRVTAFVTKIKRKTFDCTEAERSYRPGTLWNISKTDDTIYLFVN